jgi:hypothetical protein
MIAGAVRQFPVLQGGVSMSVLGIGAALRRWRAGMAMPTDGEEIERVKGELHKTTGHHPTHVYLHPKDARGIAVVCGLAVRTCAELPRGQVVVALELPPARRAPR